MERPEPYDIVVSRAGHDAGKLFMVVGSRQGRLLLCNGRNRRLANPKCKSPKHVRIAQAGTKEPAGDKDISEIIALAAQNAAAKEGRLLGER